MSKFFSSIFFFLVLLLPTVVFGQSVYMRAGKTDIYTNESVLVTLHIDTKGNSINTVGGKIEVPSSVSVGDIRYGSSIISLWVDKPAWNSTTRQILFTGGIPGGFNSGLGTIMSFVIRSNQVGPFSVSLKDVSVLLNDGSGSELPVSTPTLFINVSKAPETPKIDIKTQEKIEPTRTETESLPVDPVLPDDTTPPEFFAPMLSRHESIEENKYFVSFFAVDKDSGVAKYELMEKMSGLHFLGDKFKTKWEEVNSPYVLKYQSWGSEVVIKAYDAKGNYLISSVKKPFDGKILVVFFVGAITVTFLVTRKWFILKPRRRVLK